MELDDAITANVWSNIIQQESIYKVNQVFAMIYKEEQHQFMAWAIYEHCKNGTTFAAVKSGLSCIVPKVVGSATNNLLRGASPSKQQEEDEKVNHLVMVVEQQRLDCSSKVAAAGLTVLLDVMIEVWSAVLIVQTQNYVGIHTGLSWK